MKHSKFAGGFLGILGLLCLIFDSKTAIAGASDGIQICIETVIPSLFPFFVISSLLTGVFTGKSLSVLGKIGKKLGIPQGAEPLVIIGFLGGYPVGAQCVAQACKYGRLSSEDGERMLAFCSNAGPAFLFGLGGVLFEDIRICWILWMIHILSALFVAVITPKTAQLPFRSTETPPTTLVVSLQCAVKNMAIVCGWIILFRTIIGFCRRWFLWYFPSSISLLFSGLLELTNGCLLLTEISSLGLRMELFSLLLGFGGICVLLQTKSALSDSPLHGKAYFPGKIAQSAMSFLLCLIAQIILPTQQRYYPSMLFVLSAVTICVGYGFYCAKWKNFSSNVQRHGV